ncbi:MAG: MerC domain-containing protein [Chitinophagaceae bacterium]
MLRKINWDALGVGASVACAIHCALLPLIFTSLPFFGIDFITNKVFEYGMIALAFVIGVIALSHGYRKHHHRLIPILFFSAGFVFLIAKEWLASWEIPFLIVAVLLILTAHYINYRQCRGHNHAHKEDCDH